MAVACVVDPFVFLPQVKAPVLLEVAVADQGAELENGFGSVESPSGAGTRQSRSCGLK